MVGNLDVLSRRSGFNAALRHFKRVTGFIGEITKGANLADLLAEAIENGEMERSQMAPAVSALLVDKFGYHYRSTNAPRTVEDAGVIAARLAEWSAIQVVITYEHPQAGLFVINPKKESSWEAAVPVLQDELVVVYVQSLDDSVSGTVLDQALTDVYRLINGEDVTTKKAYVSDRAPAPKPAARTSTSRSPAAASGGSTGSSGTKRRMTPRYSVVVTNELFHNGNVEAWKRIIASYRQKHPSLDVLIWYDNERINDINALFKWGKVKHGTPILVSVVGDNMKDVSKLQRYLFEGASPRFEMFLKGGIDQPLDLF
ncbi:MAG TPA: hypothetical protein VJ932_08645 [Alkalispirochaeta sp.]|nr:hypothetical protein [Alkalispirochaeta sp.]